MDKETPASDHHQQQNAADGLGQSSSLTRRVETPNQNGKTTRPAVSSKQWPVLLGELIHLIGLFLTHSKNAEGVRATDVLFDQMARQMDLLSKMPGHEGGILVRRTHCKAPVSSLDADYSAFCGDLMVTLSDDASTIQPATHLKSAINQAFQCFSEQGIHSLYLQMPGDDPKKIDQLRLAMNIMARFQSAVNDSSSIRFRCYGRALTFPVINDAYGKPDPNLTLTAALNGLSPVNTRELVKQAAAFHNLKTTESGEPQSSERINSFNQIFATRSLRSQIAKPPIEINNLPWLHVNALSAESSTCQPEAGLDSANEDQASESGPASVDKGSATSSTSTDPAISPEQCRQLVAPYLNLDDAQHRSGFEALLADDYGDLSPLAIGERLIIVTRLLFVLDKSCQDPAVMEHLVDLFQRRLRKVHDDVLSNIIAKRRSLKIIAEGRTVVVGMVHPRLFDVITLVTEHVVAARRMAIIHAIAFDFDPCHTKALADGFGITDSDAHHILKILDGCFNAHGSFVRPTFEGRIGVMAQYENVIFEILWCFLKETPRRQDRLNFLNALQLLMVRLQNPKRATQFLLADICQTPSKVAFTDRNAFSLANILLHQENKELYVDINRTPEDVLTRQRRINKEVRRYAFWRLDVDRVRITSKMRTIHQFLLDALNMPGGERRPFETPFLMALEREAIIFLAIVGGHTARSYLRELITQYGSPGSDLYQQAVETKSLSDLMAQLQIVIRAIGRAGNSEDVELLRALQDKEDEFCQLAPHPAHCLSVKQSLKWVSEAIKMLHPRA